MALLNLINVYEMVLYYTKVSRYIVVYDVSIYLTFVVCFDYSKAGFRPQSSRDDGSFVCSSE